MALPFRKRKTSDRTAKSESHSKKTKSFFASRLRLLCFALVSVVIVSGGYYFFFYMYTPGSYIRAQEISLPAFPALKSTDRITVVAPHLDDEGLGVGGLLAQARKQGIPVSIIFMTNGDGNYYGADITYKTLRPSQSEYVEYGKLRQQEALKATARLGVESSDVYFLGLPDRGLDDLLDSKYYDTPYTSPYTGKSSSPYELSAVPNLAYTGKDSEQALTDLINKTQPTLLFAPLLQDKHPDHASTGRYVQKELANLTSHPHAYLYLVHYPKFPAPRGIDPSLPLVPPAKLANLDWESIALPTDIVEIKRQSIEDYVSQIKIPEVKQLMRSLVRRNELVVDGF